jgi:hypothetical protein
METHQKLTKVGNHHHHVIMPIEEEEQSLEMKGNNHHHVTPTQEEPPLAKKDDVWRSCCFDLSSSCVAYTGQLLVTLSVIGISTFFLIRADGNCEQSSPYINLISFLIGKILSSVISSSPK